MKKILSLYFLLSTGLLFAQEKRDNIWMLSAFYNSAYPKAGINFNSGTADTFSLFRPMAFFITNASICDTSGQLLFYTNGVYIANANHDTLLNSQDFNPGDETTDSYPDGNSIPQGTIIIPKPGSDSLYYVFHESGMYFNSHGQSESQPLHLSYSEIDMSLDNGLGGITSSKKNVHLIDDTLLHGRIAACKHANGRDWWIVVSQFYSNKYYKILVTPDSIYAPLNTQTIGDSIKYDALGQAVFSPDGTKYAMIGQNSNIEFFHFDRCSGNFTSAEHVYLAQGANGIFGGAFSANSRYLYASNYDNIFQFDTDSFPLDSSKIIVANWIPFNAPFPTEFFNMQLAPDNKIYIGTYGGCYILHYIENPDSAGLSCNVIQDSLWLPRANITVPNYPFYNLGADSGSVCDTLMLSTHKNISETTDLSISIFPNPAQDFFYIKYEIPANKTEQFILYNSFGEEVLSKNMYGTVNPVSIQVKDLQNGFYYWKLRNHSGKIIVIK